MRKPKANRKPTKIMTNRVRGMDTVDLIASGYEWTCPKCDTLNEEIEVTEKVSCRNCRRIFKVQDYQHAIE
jgi:DNA-directed RNA polymerase subunit RPC12/RpoP